MKIGIIGLPQVGKKTLFELLTGEKIKDSGFSGKADVKMGAAIIRDSRFDKIVQIYQPAKQVPATIDVVLLPKFDKETVTSGQFQKAVESCDALCHIVRVFKDESVFHIEGSLDPLRDAETVLTELILSDLILVEKRLERLSKEVAHKPDPNQVKEKEILERMKKLLDENTPLITLSLTAEEQKIMSTYKFLTRKPLIIVLNVGEDQLSDQGLVRSLEEKYRNYDIKVMQISAKIEAELDSLEWEERESFLEELNIKESALNQLSHLYYEALGLITFFTAGENEVRAWTTKQQSTAPVAAGTIHSDMQRGFIRAEIMKCQDLFECGSEAKVKETGKFMLKGKDYVIQDGDIMFVRFSV